MKKIYSLFILSILALTMFVGCQMPTEDILKSSYTVNIADSEHGTITTDKGTAKEGEIVTITIEPDSGYELDNLSVKTLTSKVTHHPNDDKTSATFLMPNESVEVKASFKVATDDDSQTETPTVDPDEVTYGFVKTVDYTVVGNPMANTMTGEQLIALAKEKNLVKDTDYTIDGTTVTLTESGVNKIVGNTDDDNTSNGGDTPTDDNDNEEDPVDDTPTDTPTDEVTGYSLSVNASNGYVITGGGMKKAGTTVTLPITHYNGTDYVTPTATDRYLVKVHIYEGETELNINDVEVKGHKIQFTMPEKNINVFAEFCDIKTKPSADVIEGEDILKYKAVVMSGTVQVRLVLYFDNKVYDNLSEVVDGKYVFDVGLLGPGEPFYFTEICSDPKFGAIDNGLKPISPVLGNTVFMYSPTASLQSN